MKRKEILEEIKALLKEKDTATALRMMWEKEDTEAKSSQETFETSAKYLEFLKAEFGEFWGTYKDGLTHLKAQNDAFFLSLIKQFPGLSSPVVAVLTKGLCGTCGRTTVGRISNSIEKRRWIVAGSPTHPKLRPVPLYITPSGVQAITGRSLKTWILLVGMLISQQKSNNALMVWRIRAPINNCWIMPFIERYDSDYDEFRTETEDTDKLETSFKEMLGLRSLRIDSEQPVYSDRADQIRQHGYQAWVKLYKGVTDDTHLREPGFITHFKKSFMSRNEILKNPYVFKSFRDKVESTEIPM